MDDELKESIELLEKLCAGEDAYQDEKIDDNLSDYYKYNIFKEREQKEKAIKQIKNKNRKMIFKKIVPTVLVGTILVSPTIYTVKNLKNIKQIFAANKLEIEVATHGGYKENGEYVTNFEKHIYNDCSLAGDGSIEDRIREYCFRNDLSDEICDLAIQKFNYYYDNDFKNGDLIELVKSVILEQKEEKENNNYGMN